MKNSIVDFIVITASTFIAVSIFFITMAFIFSYKTIPF